MLRYLFLLSKILIFTFSEFFVYLYRFKPKTNLPVKTNKKDKMGFLFQKYIIINDYKSKIGPITRT